MKPVYKYSKSQPRVWDANKEPRRRNTLARMEQIVPKIGTLINKSGSAEGTDLDLNIQTKVSSLYMELHLMEYINVEEFHARYRPGRLLIEFNSVSNGDHDGLSDRPGALVRGLECLSSNIRGEERKCGVLRRGQTVDEPQCGTAAGRRPDASGVLLGHLCYFIYTRFRYLLRWASNCSKNKQLGKSPLLVRRCRFQFNEMLMVNLN